MHVISAPYEFNTDDVFVDLEPAIGQRLMLKCEGFNFAGSIKLKAARAMVEDAEREGRLRPGSMIVESSSGNLGVALSLVAAAPAAPSGPVPEHDDEAFRRDAVAAKNRLARTLGDPVGHRDRILAELVRETAGTAFGTGHAMSRVRTIDDYRAAVPLRTYQEYEPWIARSAAGESRVLTQEDPGSSSPPAAAPEPANGSRSPGTSSTRCICRSSGRPWACPLSTSPTPSP
ncbi:pyridoxal-phosphate dependent enzyme, partial [Streptomyces sp. DT225]